MSSPIKISFLGGASEIGASCALVEVAGQAILIDCGVRFRADRALPDMDQLSGKKVGAILVTHAHSDHTGGLPVAHEAFPSAPIYMTPPTRSLVEILQRDAIRLMQQSGERDGDVPLYTERQVEGMLDQILLVHHHASVVVGDIRATYLPASHILGASMIHLETPGGNVLFTGDYSTTAQRTVPRLETPDLPVDLVITESTYGNRLHADRKLAEDKLIDTIAGVVDKGGRVIIPAFAIGRAQEVLLILRDALQRKKMPRVPVFADGMVRAVCGAYFQHEHYLTPSLQRQMKATGHPFFNQDVRAVTDVQHRKQIAGGGACVVVSSSGMLSGGPSAFFAAEFAPNEKDAILITGYQDEESPGRALLNLLQQPQDAPRKLAIAGREVDVRCRFSSYSLSAHADRLQMVGLIEGINPRAVGLVHGDGEAKDELARSLGRGRDVILCNDGMTLERSYPRRGAGRRAATARPELDRERAEALVGPDEGKPVDLGALCLAWFGHDVPAEERKAFGEQLLRLGVVWRDIDDSLRPMQAPDPTAAEAELEEQMKRENPKGRLLEWCMRNRMEFPPVRESIEGDRYALQLSVTLAGKEVKSDVVRASSRKLVEQLAAADLLGKIETDLGDVSLREVTEQDAARLKAANAKGKMLELCAKLKIVQPGIEVRTHPKGHLRRAGVKLPGRSKVFSRWCLAPVARDAEQAASEEILAVIEAWRAGRLPEEGADATALLASLAPAPPEGAPAAPAKPLFMQKGYVHPKSALNTLQQTKKIGACAFDVVSQKGSAHSPIFEVRGWAEVSGQKMFGPTQTGPSKKDAEAAAAASLLAMLEQHLASLPPPGDDPPGREPAEGAPEPHDGG